jgi:hypothetical protein
VEQVQRSPALHDDAARQLSRLVSRLRLRLGLERSLVLLVRGAAVAAALFTAYAIALWLIGVESAPGWVAGAPLLIAGGMAVLTWPTPRQTALAADARLGLEERLTTAVERLGHPHPARFDRLQMRDAAASAAAAPSTWLTLNGRLRFEGLAAAALVALALATALILPSLPRPRIAAPGGDVATVTADTPGDQADQTVPDGITPEAATVAATQPAQQAQADPNLAARVQQQQAERDALNQLSQALGSVSAGQSAANAIQQNDFSSAADQLRNLGDNADQLSDAAKQQLAAALSKASAASAQSDRQLADKEQQAARALSKSTYNDQRQALRGLADQLERSGTNSVPADQLEREQGQLQQQNGLGQASQSPTSAAAAGQAASAAAQAAGADPNGPPGGTPTGTQSLAAGGQSGTPQGQQGGAGVGTGTDPNMLGNQESRLETSGQNVQVPARLGSGPGVRPADGTEDQTGANPSLGGGNVAQVPPQAQQTGQVAPEQNLVPGGQRPVVRGYFR